MVVNNDSQILKRIKLIQDNNDGDFAGATMSLKAIAAAVTDLAGGGRLKVLQSDVESAYIDDRVRFQLTLIDSDTGPIASGDITAGGAIGVYKSTGGGAFSKVGITQATWTVANGLIYFDYTFDPIEGWLTGDLCHIVAEGNISVDIDGETVYVPFPNWTTRIVDPQVNRDSPQGTTYNHASGTGESQLGGALQFTSSTDQLLLKGVWLDMVNITQQTRIRLKHAIDGTNRRTFFNFLFDPAIHDDGVLINLAGIGLDGVTTVGMIITIQSIVAEGAARNIPWQVYWEPRRST